MRILHLASFHGNIGDWASHRGTYRILRKYYNCEIDRLEIRKFYKVYDLPDKMEYNDNFVRLVNKHDMLVIGGGAYLDYFLDSSSNATTLDISKENLAKIKVPILIVSMGCLPRGGDYNYQRVREFLDTLKPRAHVFLRNDGSGKRFPDFPQVSDSGIFYAHNGKCGNGDYIAVNVATDLYENPKLIVSEMARFINNTHERVIIVPHNYHDFKTVGSVLNEVHYWDIAKRVSVAPYWQGIGGSEHLFSIYANSKQVVACRYHANLCSIAMGKPTVGIAVSEKVRECYKSFGSEAVKAEHGFSDRIKERFKETFDTTEQKESTLETYDKYLREAGV